MSTTTPAPAPSASSRAPAASPAAAPGAMSQADIRAYYRDHWREVDDRRLAAGGDESAMGYSSPVQDAVQYRIYERLVADLGLRLDGGRILDVGCGAGRWIRFLLERWTPAQVTGIDFAEASIAMLEDWAAGRARVADGSGGTAFAFAVADVTDASLDLGARFDVINVANVLYHVPEDGKFLAALATLRRHLAPGGRIVTTEFMPRTTMRTPWMKVRSRYELEAACRTTGLAVAHVRAAGFFTAEPMGFDGPDSGVRRRFQAVRGAMKHLVDAAGAESRSFLVDLFAEIDLAATEFCAERIADVDLPAQKFVVLRAAD